MLSFLGNLFSLLGGAIKLIMFRSFKKAGRDEAISEGQEELIDESIEDQIRDADIDSDPDEQRRLLEYFRNKK